MRSVFFIFFLPCLALPCSLHILSRRSLYSSVRAFGSALIVNPLCYFKFRIVCIYHHALHAYFYFIRSFVGPSILIGISPYSIYLHRSFYFTFSREFIRSCSLTLSLSLILTVYLYSSFFTLVILSSSLFLCFSYCCEYCLQLSVAVVDATVNSAPLDGNVWVVVVFLKREEKNSHG